ncbi:divisome-associated lipoprotein YraP [Muribacter muris]|uniref:Divisome-associated lipoprotein YraP n=1 Tax=Muribacter muris TaxID=67855 RepID=A0A4Y9K5T7_9PAST|nr:division/outer membrane stress-associated lipid-binding lipoprotein [Muribacter muris]MBF0784096.1 divisome-associated lipoprotein YraP [Muribacter muris]MBF0827591.1 divisome-associated lipoprotein YraP [Muribacter muris]TFV13148.1 divisome-associated lipoprotein YraP [Muribacter muris]
MSSRLKHFTLIGTLTLCCLFLQGCLATAVVGGAAAAAKVATDPRTAGRQLDDETLEEKVAYQLNKDDQIKEEARINVVSYNGKVLLIGQAPTEMAKETAKSIAAGVEGVSTVYNEIRIGQKIGIGQISQDSWITTKVKSQLLVNSQVKTTEVKVITENGEVFLMGNLSNTQANAAAEVARNVRGVNKVVKVITYVQ